MNDTPRPPDGSSPARPRLTVHFVVLCLLAGVFSTITLLIIRPLLIPLFLAAVFAILAAPLQERLSTFEWLQRLGGRWTVGGLLTLLILLVVLAFPAGIAYLAFTQSESVIVALGGGPEPLAATATGEPESLPKLSDLTTWLARTSGRPEDEVRGWLLEGATQLRELLYTRAAGFLGSLPELLMGLTVFVFALFFFLADSARMQTAWEAITPLPIDHDRLLRRNFARVCRGLVAATLLASLAQAATFALGLLAIEMLWRPGLGTWIFSLTLACWACSLIPFIGAWVVWLPTAVGLLVAGYPLAGVVLAVYGTAVVSQIDNVIRVWVLHGTARIHPLLGFVTIIGGIRVFGLFGLLLAPVVAAVTVTLLRILRAETIRLAADAQGRDATPRRLPDEMIPGTRQPDRDGRTEPFEPSSSPGSPPTG